MPRPNQRVISLPKDLVDDVEAFVEDHPRLGYTSIADFVKSAIRLRMATDVQIEDLKRDAAEALADDSSVQLAAVKQLLEAEGVGARVRAEELVERIRKLMAAGKTGPVKRATAKKSGARKATK